MVVPERVWTPWRMTYLTGDAREDGCVFCNRLAGEDDVASLILHRGEHTFVIMNLFPYGSGHLMILPNIHAASPVDLDPATRHEIADTLPMLMTVLQRVFGCEGFNSGFNLGVAGGAGIAEHLHQHVVPRWIGDANFFPIIASTKAIPELLPSQYAKLRPEIERELGGPQPVSIVALTQGDSRVLTIGGRLPSVVPDGDAAVWKAALGEIQGHVTAIDVAGWGGPRQCNGQGRPAIVLRGHLLPGAVAIAPADLAPTERSLVQGAISGLAPFS
jgi:ATP adenylyltransferase